jgi:[ribosomal protein S5]-alanine N-acetyltransferase
MAELELETERLILSLPQLELAPHMVTFLERNRDHLAPWRPPEPEGLYTTAYWATQIPSLHDSFASGSGVRLWIRPKIATKQIIGSIGFTQIFRGPFASCILGYQLDHEFEGKGMMREALETAIAYMFNEQKLHRVAANYRPENVRSGRLLARLGFRIEGFAKNYLFIDGDWRDHVLTAQTNDVYNNMWLVPSSIVTNSTANIRENQK